MEKHPFESVMNTTMENLKQMVDVSTVVGDPVFADGGTTIIPISKVSFGFVAGGGEYSQQEQRSAPDQSAKYPFAGGAGAGVSVNPMGFLVVNKEQVRILSVQQNTVYDKLIDMVPQIINKVSEHIKMCNEEKFEEEQIADILYEDE